VVWCGGSGQLLLVVAGSGVGATGSGAAIVHEFLFLFAIQHFCRGSGKAHDKAVD
jgi:hypothetical protein